MAMTMEERLLAAETLLRRMGAGESYPCDELAFESVRAAFPELFDGTAWLAPMEPTEAMRVAGWPHFSALGDKPNGALDFADRRYAAMRDAHLSPETDAKVEG